MASKPKDPYAKPLLIVGLAVLAGTALVLVFNLIGTINNNATVGVEDNTMRLAMVEENIKPIGTVVAMDKTAAPVAAVARTGEEVYNAACTTCHAAGTLGAPKLDKESWSERIAKGLDGLLQNAINGINQMPARGGDPSITDQELENAIIYMTNQAGYDLGDDATQQVAMADEANDETDSAATDGAAADSEMTQMAEADAEADVEQAATAEDMAAKDTTDSKQTAAEPLPPHASINGEEVYKGICFSCHDSGLINSPVLGDTAAWEPRIAKGLETLYDHSINGFNAMPAKGGNPALSDDEVKAAVDYMVVEAGGTLPYGAADASDDTSDATEESTAQDAQAAESEAAQDTAETTSQEVAHAGIDGEAVYKGLCFSCHDNGVAGSPIVGDKAAWQDRIAKGKETLYDHSINGFNAMPAKGGNPTLSDNEIKAAVDWMVSQSE